MTKATIANPTMNPTTGDITMNEATFVIPDQLIASRPMAATPAPISPPTREWLLEAGIPSHHVIRFQAIAPIRADRTSSRPYDSVTRF
jgi:hypothetical protein